MNMIDGACSLAIMKSSLTMRDPKRKGEGMGGVGRRCKKEITVFPAKLTAGVQSPYTQ